MPLYLLRLSSSSLRSCKALACLYSKCFKRFFYIKFFANISSNIFRPHRMEDFDVHVLGIAMVCEMENDYTEDMDIEVLHSMWPEDIGTDVGKNLI
ncbi:hypothetical protein K1719_029658 [Acacia pycnantha]|nr:hypothetical protein K1719_029658 [Acacia pycnantha]